MNTDEYGLVYYNELELFKALYKDPTIDLGKFSVLDPDRFNSSVKMLYSDAPTLKRIEKPTVSVDEFDKANQSKWNMPKEYQELDIAKTVLDSCNNDDELQRCGKELLLFQERKLLNLLRFLKYFVDTMRTNNVVIGLGRGSSVSSFVLYKLGIHKVNSMFYDLDVEEFLR